MTDDPLDLAVVLQQLDGEEAGRVFVTYVFVPGDGFLHLIDVHLQFRTMIDVYVPVGMAFFGIAVFIVLGEVRHVVLISGGYIRLVPVLQLLEDLRIDFPVLVEEVTSFVDIDYDMKQVVDAFVGTAHGGDHRDAEHFAQHAVVELVAAGFQFVKHVQGNDHTHVHVNELGRQVEVAFQVGCIHDVDDDIRGLFDDVLPYIHLFGRVGREGIGAREVDDAELVALELEESFLGVYRHTAVVSHMLVCSGRDVEQGGLPAIGIAHQRNVDGASFVPCDILHLFDGDFLGDAFLVFGLDELLGFFFADDFNHGCLLAS